MTLEDALALVRRTPQLAHLSGVARQICAYAIAVGTPLRVVTNSEDAVTLLRSEQLVRIEGDRIDSAVAIARTGVDDATLRGCVRAARSLLAEDECSALMMEHGHETLASMERGELAELGLVLFARTPATVDEAELVHQVDVWFPPPAPVELSATAGDVIGECASCNGAVTFDATVALKWKGSWELVDPSQRTETALRGPTATAVEYDAGLREAESIPESERTGERFLELRDRAGELRQQYLTASQKYESARSKPPTKTSKVYAVLNATMPLACTACAMSWKHGELELPAEEADIPAATATAATAPFMGGLIDVGRAISDAIGRLPEIDPDKLAKLDAVVPRDRPYRRLEVALLALAWQETGTPLRVSVDPVAADRLARAVDVAMRGGYPQRIVSAAGAR